VRRRWLDRDLSARAFALGLLAIVAVGIAARVLYVEHVTDTYGFDARWYYLQAGSIGDGDGFLDPTARLTTGDTIATAAHPPAYPTLLAAEYKFGAQDIETFQLLGALVGAATIALTGLFGSTIGGRTVGLVAAGIVALDPMLIAADGSLMSENLYVLLVIAAMLCALRAVRDGGWGWWIGLGGLLGVSLLTRGDALAFVLVLMMLVFLVARKQWARAVAAMSVAALLVVPWVVRNAREVGEATLATSSSATAAAGANCAATYSGDAIGLWDHACTHEERRATQDEAEWSAGLRRDAREYATGHITRLPIVAVARLARSTGIWAPRGQATFEAVETRAAGWQFFALITQLLLLGAGIFGIVRGAIDRAARWILAAPVVAGFLVVVAGYANSRFLVLAAPALALGAALAVTWNPSRATVSS
jgi:4-amino-4-deoxy-L-arabinose transferase-like glycosyltransferase